MKIVSVIIPTYNRMLYLQDAINSVLSQTYNNFEIIVVDDGSTDNTKEFIEQFYPEIKYAYQENRGPGSARNFGARLALGKYLAFLDSDDIWHPQKLEIQMDVLSRNVNISVLSTIMIDYSRKCIKNTVRFNNMKVSCYHLNELLVKQQIATPTVVVEKEFFNSSGGFREDLKLCEDHDLWFRLAEKTSLYKVMFPLVYYRCLDSGLSAGDREKTHKAYINFMKSIYKIRYPQMLPKLLPIFLSTYYYSMSIEYTETNKTILALRCLLKSWWYSPFKLSKNYKGCFLRVRRLAVILNSFFTYGFRRGASNRIIILCSGLDHIKRGVETWAQDLASVLKENDVKVNLYKGSGKRNGNLETVIPCLCCGSGVSKAIQHILLPFRWHFGFGSEFQAQQTTFTLNLIPELLIKKFDIVHTQDPDTANIVRILNKIGLIKSKVILAHGTEEPFAFIKKFDYLQHLAPHHLEEAQQAGLNGKKHFVIPNFVDTAKFSPINKSNLRFKLGIPEHAFCILTSAAVKKTHKRIDYLIQEFSLLLKKSKRTDLYLIIAGASSPETQELIRYGNELLGDKVRFLINLNHDEMPQVYNTADLFVLCSLKEMMPIALVEAISSGVPCVCHDYPVMKWIIGKGGECIDMNKEGGLAATIEKYFDKQLRQTTSQNARKRAVDNFSKDVVVRQIIEMYQEVIKCSH